LEEVAKEKEKALKSAQAESDNYDDDFEADLDGVEVNGGSIVASEEAKLKPKQNKKQN